MKNGFCLLALFLTLVSCQEEQDSELLSLEQFNLQSTALHEGEIVEVIYSTVGRDKGEVPDYYFPCVVVSLETGDTVNVFMPFQSMISENDLIRSFNSRSSSFYNTVTTSMMSDGQIGDESNYSKVAIPLEDQSFVNPYRRTTIGVLGKVKLRNEGTSN